MNANARDSASKLAMNAVNHGKRDANRPLHKRAHNAVSSVMDPYQRIFVIASGQFNHSILPHVVDKSYRRVPVLVLVGQTNGQAGTGGSA
jgi:hypothetical protein